MKRSALSLRAFLVGGDRRSIARSGHVLALVRAEPARAAEVAALTRDRDWLVCLRALDLLEKLARECPEWIEPHKSLFLSDLADSDKWEVRLQIVRALPLFQWRTTQRRRAVAILRRDLEHPQKFVKAWALDGLAAMSLEDSKLRSIVLRYVRTFEQSGSKALLARARHVRDRLAKGAIPRDPVSPRPAIGTARQVRG